MLDISEVARRSGLPASTLRYYEERGLVASIGRRGLRRTFDPDVLRRLAFITLGRSVGFSLDEIAAMIGCGGELRLDRRMLAVKADELDATIVKLTIMRDELRHAVACPHANHVECANFQHRMEAVVGSRYRLRAATVK